MVMRTYLPPGVIQPRRNGRSLCPGALGTHPCQDAVDRPVEPDITIVIASAAQTEDDLIEITPGTAKKQLYILGVVVPGRIREILTLVTGRRGREPTRPCRGTVDLTGQVLGDGE